MPATSNIVPLKFVDGSGTATAAKQWEETRDRAKALTTGFAQLDSIWAPASGQFHLLAARPGCYKTTLSWQIGCNLALQGKRVLWVNLEPSMAQMFEMWASRMARIPRRQLGPHGTGLNLVQQTALMQAMEAFKRLPIVFHFQDNSIQSVLERAKRAPYDAIFVDYLQLLSDKRARSAPERIEAVSHALRDYAHSANVLVFALVQMNRSIERDDDEERLPKLSDLAGSAALEADADVVSFMFDKKQRGEMASVTCYVGKNRSGEPDKFIMMHANGAMCEVSEHQDFIPAGATKYQPVEATDGED